MDLVTKKNLSNLALWGLVPWRRGVYRGACLSSPLSLSSQQHGDLGRLVNLTPFGTVFFWTWKLCVYIIYIWYRKYIYIYVDVCMYIHILETSSLSNFTKRESFATDILDMWRLTWEVTDWFSLWMCQFHVGKLVYWELDIYISQMMLYCCIQCLGHIF